MVVFALGILLAACGGRKTADKNQTAVMESLDSLERQADSFIKWYEEILTEKRRFQ